MISHFSISAPDFREAPASVFVADELNIAKPVDFGKVVWQK
jgi:hypothetical protein